MSEHHNFWRVLRRGMDCDEGEAVSGIDAHSGAIGLPAFEFISFFSGGMGLDLGLEAAGGIPVACNEVDQGAIDTIRANKPHLRLLDCPIEQVSGAPLLHDLGRARGDVDLVCGGPPCQSFSVYGNRAGAIDPRGQLVFEFQRLVGEILPRTFLMENVRGLHSMPLVPSRYADRVDNYEPWMSRHGSLLKELLKGFSDLGYAVNAFLVNCVNYGAPQIRERLLLIGSRAGLAPSFPMPTHSNRPSDGLLPFQTLRDAIGPGFIDADPDLMNFSPRKLRYLAMVPPGGNWRSMPVEVQKESMGKSWYLKGGRSATWRRLSWDFPSPTVVTMPNHASTSMCHPAELRALTVGECAAIQEFPRDWVFKGTTASKYRQIGNAVPVRLGTVAGGVISQILREHHLAQMEPNLAAAHAPRVIHLRPHVRTKRYWHQGNALAGSHSYYDDEDDQRLFA